MRRFGLIIAVVLAGLFSSGPAFAAAQPADDAMRIRLPAQTDLAKLADLVANFADVSLQYNPQRFRGTVKLAMNREFDRQDLWRAFNQVLSTQGFTTVVVGEPAIYQVVALQEADGLSVALTPAQMAALPFPPGYLVVIEELEHIGADAAMKALQAVAGGRTTQVRTLGEQDGRLLLAGVAAKITEALRILELIDRPGVVPAVRTWRPQRAAAQSLQSSANAAWNAMDRIASAKRNVDIQVSPDGGQLLLIAPDAHMDDLVHLVESLDRAEPVETRTYRPRFFAIDDVAKLLDQVLASDQPVKAQSRQVRIVQDPLTGSLIINATLAQHARIDELLASLDSAPREARRQVRHYTVRNRDVADLAKVLGNMVSSGVLQAQVMASEVADTSSPDAPENEATEATEGAGDATSRPAPGTDDHGTGRSPVPVGGDEMALVLTTDSVTNTIIAMGEPRLLDQLADLVDELDRRQPQVELEVMLVSMNTSESRDLGLELATMFQKGETSVSLGSLFGLSEQAGDDIVSRSIGGAAQGASGLVIAPGDFAGVLRALRTVSDGESHIRAKLVVNNNTEASLNGVQQEPFTSLNSGDTVATTSFGGTSDAGTEVSITPQIAAGDHVTVAYKITQSAFTGDSTDPSIPPPKRSDSISSTATVPDSFVIALGGLSSINERVAETRLPFLGSIPVIRHLVGTESTSTNESRFYVFIRATILRHHSFEDLRHLSTGQQRAAGMEDEGWPTLEPRLVE